MITDSLTGKLTSAKSFFYFHPDVELRNEKEYFVIDDSRTDCLLKVYTEGGVAEIQDSVWYPEFGKEIRNQRIVIDIKENYSKLKVQF